MKNEKPHLIPEWMDRLPESAWPVSLDKIRRLQQGLPPDDTTVELDRDETEHRVQDRILQEGHG